MNNEDTQGAICADAANLIPNPTHNPATDRQVQLEDLFSRNYSKVVEAASASGLFVGDGDRIIHATARRLDEYLGLLEDAPFTAWIAATARPAAVRLSAYIALKATNEKVVLKALWSVVGGCTDLGGDEGTVRELAHNVWVKVFLDLEAWISAGVPKIAGGKPPKISTRLYGKARAEALGWRTDRLRSRARYVDYGDGVKIESLVLDKQRGYGRLYPESLKPKPFDQTPTLRKKDQNSSPIVPQLAA